MKENPDRKKKTLRANNLRILRIQNTKFPEYYFHMNMVIKGDFQICINVPLSFVNPRKDRSSRFQMFFKIGVVKNFRNFTRKHVLESLFNFI